jgi:Secretory lipase
MRRRPLAALLVALVLAAGCSSSAADGSSSSTSSTATESSSTASVSPATSPEGGPTSSDGDFYQPPSPLPAGPDGTILRKEPLAVAGGATAWRVLYRSERVDGTPVAVSGMVAVPRGEPPAGGWPVVSWAHGTTGSADNCAPSREGTATIAPLGALLDAGYVVAATDYEGLGTPGPHPYLVGASEGRSVLDAARAARRLVPEATGGAVVWGHSQGGQAALWAGELAGGYAPDLDLSGVVAFAPAARLDAFLGAPGSVLLAGFTVAAAAGLAATNPQLHLDDLLTQGALDRLGALETSCIAATAVTFGAVPGGVLKTAPDELPDWKAAIAANEAGEHRTAAPVLVAQGDQDPLVRPAVAQLYAQRACASGSLVDLRSYAGRDHGDIVDAAEKDALAWTVDRLDDRPAVDTC